MSKRRQYYILDIETASIAWYKLNKSEMVAGYMQRVCLWKRGVHVPSMTMVILNLEWTKLPMFANLERHHRDMEALCGLPSGAINHKIPLMVDLLYSVW